MYERPDIVAMTQRGEHHRDPRVCVVLSPLSPSLSNALRLTAWIQGAATIVVSSHISTILSLTIAYGGSPRSRPRYLGIPSRETSEVQMMVNNPSLSLFELHF